MTDYFLSKGKHFDPNEGRCAMEWVAYLAGEPHSDSPSCVSGVLKAFCIRLNDGLENDQRQKLRPFLARTIGTANDGMDIERAFMCADWAVRTCLPMVLLQREGVALRSLPRVIDRQTAAAAAKAAAAATAANAATAAISTAAATAAKAAAANAAKAAAANAAKAAANAAKAAAYVAAKAAAAAANAAISAAGRDRGDVVKSALELLDRMLPTEAIQLPRVFDSNLLCEFQS